MRFLFLKLGQVEDNRKIKKDKGHTTFIANIRCFYMFALYLQKLPSVFQPCSQKRRAGDEVGFFFFSFLFFVNYQNFMNVHILFQYIMSILLTTMMKYFLYFLQFSAISFILWKTHDKVEHQGNLSRSLIKTVPKAGGFLEPVIGIPERFQYLYPLN